MVESYVEKLNYQILELKTRRVVGWSVFVGKNDDASLKTLAQDTLAHLKAIASSKGTDILSLRI